MVTLTATAINREKVYCRKIKEIRFVAIYFPPLSSGQVKINPGQSPPERLRDAGKAPRGCGRSKDFPLPSTDPSVRPEYPWARFSLGMRQKGTGGYRAPGRAAVLAWAPGAAPAPNGAGSADPLAFSIIELVAFF